MHVLPLFLQCLSMYCTYTYTYIIIKICIHEFSPSMQILMSVVLEHIVVLKHVQTLKEVSIVDVIVALYWMMMGLLVMVCIQTFAYMTVSVKTSITSFCPEVD